MSIISIIIPVSSELDAFPVLPFLENIDYPKDEIEIILSIGKWPPLQRNKAAETAKGEILYFLNRDARLEPDFFNKVITIFNSNSNIAGVGGPDLTPSGNTYLQYLFGYAMGSYFGHWKMRARYLAVGRQRISNEKELLLSNMSIRKDVYLKFNGFDERLYPNEENEIINRIIKGGYHFIYSPDVKIYRDRRKNLFEFARQFFRYGKGRMNQIFIEGAIKNLPFFIPLSLLVYILIMPFLGKFGISLILIYVLVSIVDALYLSFKNKKNLVLQLPPIYLIMHIAYAFGMLGGLSMILTGAGKQENKDEIKIKKIRFPDTG